MVATAMRRTIAIIITATIIMSACTSETPYGDCVGIVDEGRADTTYTISGWNLGVSILLVGTIIVPVLWATDYAKCPVSRKPHPVSGEKQGSAP